MELDFFWLGLGLAVAGYFIGDGLKYFKSNKRKSMVDHYSNWYFTNELIKEKDIHHFLGMDKQDAKKLVEQYPDIPHLNLNGNIYFPQEKLRQWLHEKSD